MYAAFVKESRKKRDGCFQARSTIFSNRPVASDRCVSSSDFVSLITRSGSRRLTKPVGSDRRARISINLAYKASQALDLTPHILKRPLQLWGDITPR